MESCHVEDVSRWGPWADHDGWSADHGPAPLALSFGPEAALQALLLLVVDAA